MLHDGISPSVSKADVIRVFLLDGVGLGGMVGSPDTRFNKPPSVATSPCFSGRPASAIVRSSLPVFCASVYCLQFLSLPMMIF